MADRRQPGMGAIPHERGTTFRVWAPHADGVSVIGTFNGWTAGKHPLTYEGRGYWAADLPVARPGDEYRYLIVNGAGQLERVDPYARWTTRSGQYAIIYQSAFGWDDDRLFEPPASEDLVIYEMHIGTFNAQAGKGPGTFYTAIERLGYLADLGVTAIELMPVMEFPGDHGWGYNVVWPFAVESEYGGPDALKAFVKAAHQHGIAVLLDVILNHLGPHELGLWRFDGWYENDLGGIYFYNDERAATPWGHTRPDYTRPEVRQYLRDNVLYWFEEYHVDGQRWDATHFMRDIYGHPRQPDGNLPEGEGLIRCVSREVRERFPGAYLIAEDLHNLEWITQDLEVGGGGFDAQWDPDFFHPVQDAILPIDDALRDLEAVRSAILHHFEDDPFKRVVYVELHDEVGDGRVHLTQRISPDDSLSWRAKKQVTLGTALVFTAPGIPTVLQGQEFLTDQSLWQNEPLDWQRARSLPGIVDLHRDLIALRRNLRGTTRGLRGRGVEVHHLNEEAKVIAFHRWDRGGRGDDVVVALNMSEHTLAGYRLGFPAAGRWRLRFDSHAAAYDPEFTGQVSKDVDAGDIAWDGHGFSAEVAIGPYAAIILSQDR